MDISSAGLDLIKKWEGFYPNAYDDGEGVWTIGYGTVRWDLKTPVKKGDTITREEAERQLRKELQRVEDAIDATVKQPISQTEFDSWCAIFYNIGTGWCTGIGHQQATFVKDFNRGRKDLVPGGMMKFTRGANSGTVYQGLINRRKDEIKLFLTQCEPVEPHSGDKVVPDNPMPQAVKPDAPSPIKVIAQSPTAQAGGIGILGTLVQIWNWTFGAVKEAGVDAVANQQAIGPFDALFKAVGANMGLVAAMIVLGSLVVVVMRKINQERG